MADTENARKRERDTDDGVEELAAQEKKAKSAEAGTEDTAAASMASIDPKSEEPASADNAAPAAPEAVPVAAPSTREGEGGLPKSGEEVQPAAGASTEGAEQSAKTSEKSQEEPVKLGYKTFQNGGEAYRYYHSLLEGIRKGQDLNEYEHHMVLDLLQKGHPEPARKIGSGAEAFQVRDMERDNNTTTCFYVRRTDGSLEDFSTRKCIDKLFPSYAKTHPAKYPEGLHSPQGQRGGGQQRGRGRGGRRGRGRGHFRGRGGRGGRRDSGGRG